MFELDKASVVPELSKYFYGGLLRTTIRTRFLYSDKFVVNSWYGSPCAGLLGLGLSSNSCMPRRICFKVMEGLQSSSAFRIDKHTVPDGYTLGWNKGGTNWHFGGEEG
mmetsp:Transcript_16978/g.19299  ORF Transcript_16978/g.19299 Transcript_16978/m.19299 type:complete len:108 (+) Transcript_16978:1033-1356(+)